MKVAVHHDDRRLTVGDTLDLVPPPASHLEGSLHGLGARVHRQHHPLAREGSELGAEWTKEVVMERPAGQGKPVELSVCGGQQVGMAVAEVERRVGR
jgi:hypothetical protein